MPSFDNVNGVWRTTRDIYNHVGGVWKATRKAYDNINGVWRQFHSRTLFEDNFSEYLISPENLSGSRTNVNNGDHLFTQISGYTRGEGYAVAVGWMIKNIPANSTVTVTWQLQKGEYPRNDALVFNNAWQVIVAETNSFSTKTSTFSGQSGNMFIVINFFSTWNITTWMKIYEVKINGDRVFPVS
ncbi:hypothetical protein [Paenibacillus aquistagni]|uniref:hypothetical protein n=1 Tax=Paenibacillus aquistagni TaxID=1852522 RepID=UPI000B5016D2|nr:hypothetical protein [Paenibacillus aquistagni]